MVAPAKLNFKVYQGSTFKETFRWESNNVIYKPITAITKAAPAIVTSTAHGLPTGWRFKITNVVGMKEINSNDNYYIATDVGANNITIGALNSIAYTEYVSGGVIEVYPPEDLSQYTARMQIRAKVGSETVLLNLTTENGGIIMDTYLGTITILATPAQTELLTFSSAVYSLEMIKAGEVFQLLAGNLTLIKEVTR